MSALKHSTKALAEAEPPAATVKQPTEESTGNAARAEEHAITSTGGAATEEHANTESKEGTVQEADVQSVDEESEGCDASGEGKETDKPPPAQAQKKRTEVPKPNVAVNDIVRLSLQRNKQFYDGYEAQVIALLAREVKVLILGGPKKGQRPKLAYTSFKEITKPTQAITAALECTLPAPKKSKEMEENDQKVLENSSVFESCGDLLV